MNASPPASLLFVCLGNICRSPAAEGVATAYAARAGLSLQLDSAGTYGGHVGSLPDSRMRAAAAKRGYTLAHRARQVVAADGASFKLILAMDRSNLFNIKAMGVSGPARLELFGAFLPGVPDIPDPYHGGPEGFEQVLDMLETAMPEVLRAAMA